MKNLSIKRHWTLGGLMILIAVLAVPLSMYVRHAREVARQQAMVKAALEQMKQAIHQALQSKRPGGSSTHRPTPIL
jgi:cytochrome c-type biogenesis protein CcmH/NrfG